MKGISKILNSFLPALPYLIVFISSIFQPSDPDLGWHLKYGQYFWQHGRLLRDNTFSTMMPNFHWANTSWLTDIISYTAYHLGGLFGITVLGALVVTLTFYFFAKAFKLTLWEQVLVFPLVLYLEEPVNSISFRGQQLSLLFGGILFYLISLYEKKPKVLLLIIPLFLIWVDIDGEYFLGYALFGLWVVLYLTVHVLQKVFIKESKKAKSRNNFTLYVTRTKESLIEKKNEIFYLFGVLVVSFLVTFINPFGYGILFDAVSHIGNPLLKDIDEYLPFYYFSQEWWNEVFVGIVLVFGLFILVFKGKFLKMLPVLGGGLLLFVLSLSVRRYAWPAFYLIFPLLGMTASFLKPDGKKVTKMATIVIIILLLVLTIWRHIPLSRYTGFTWGEYCLIQVDPCTPQSAQFLIDHNLNHNIYSLYGWGGWIIWNYPQIKPTIDGRMHLWVQNGYSAFAHYFENEQNFQDIDKTSYSVAYVSVDKPVFGRLLTLTKEGKWKEVYKDTYSGIFVRND
jgi:hypothetical protein